jgi:hypothetical protein
MIGVPSTITFLATNPVVRGDPFSDNPSDRHDLNIAALFNGPLIDHPLPDIALIHEDYSG